MIIIYKINHYLVEGHNQLNHCLLQHHKIWCSQQFTKINNNLFLEILNNNPHLEGRQLYFKGQHLQLLRKVLQHRYLAMQLQCKITYLDSHNKLKQLPSNKIPFSVNQFYNPNNNKLNNNNKCHYLAIILNHFKIIIIPQEVELYFQLNLLVHFLVSNNNHKQQLLIINNHHFSSQQLQLLGIPHLINQMIQSMTLISILPVLKLMIPSIKLSGTLFKTVFLLSVLGKAKSVFTRSFKILIKNAYKKEKPSHLIHEAMVSQTQFFV